MWKKIVLLLSFLSAYLISSNRSKDKENKILEGITQSQRESLRISDAKEEVSNALHVKLEDRKSKIDKKTQELKNEVKDDSDAVMDNDFISLLNKSDIQD
jgi:hypothetical protein